MSPRVTVVIITRDRQASLMRTLDRLAELPERPPVVVVDNGSSDGTPDLVRGRVAGFPVPLRLEAEPQPGPAAARNRGAAAAAGDLILFIGDDMEPADSGLVAGHAAAHGDAMRLLVMGRATWNPARPISTFMRWLEHGGPQFDFDALARGPVPLTQLCTANISLPRALLAEAGGFDERFRYAALEDTELGVRLERLGATLRYDPDLRVLHDHPTTLADSLRRMRRVGASARLYNRLHPERPLAALPVPAGRSWRLLHGPRALGHLLRSERLPARLRERAWDELHLRAYAAGYADRAASS